MRRMYKGAKKENTPKSHYSRIYFSTPTQILPREDVAIVIWGNKITNDVSHPVRLHASKEIARRILTDTKKWPQDRFEELGRVTKRRVGFGYGEKE